MNARIAGSLTLAQLFSGAMIVAGLSVDYSLNVKYSKSGRNGNEHEEWKRLDPARNRSQPKRTGVTRAQSTPRRSVIAQTLAVPGASNSTPSLTALGRTVAAIWTATKEESTNLYLAISNDGGATFSPPRRVNDIDGDAGATNEQPPRVVFSGSSAARTLTVYGQSEIRDRSKRAATSFACRAPPMAAGRLLQRSLRTTPEFFGARGWESLDRWSDGACHAVWLDGRDAARKIAETAAHSGMAHKGQPPQDIYHGTIAADGRMARA